MASSVFLKPSGTGAAHVMQFGPVGSKIPFLTSRQISTGLIAEKTTSMAILNGRKKRNRGAAGEDCYIFSLSPD
jgi:hypothetical protein